MGWFSKSDSGSSKSSSSSSSSGSSSSSDKPKVTVSSVVDKIKSAVTTPNSATKASNVASDKAAAATKAYSAANSSTGGVGSSAGRAAETAELQKPKQTTVLDPTRYASPEQYEQAVKASAAADARANWQNERAASDSYDQKHGVGAYDRDKPADQAQAGQAETVAPAAPPVDPSAGTSYDGASDQMKAYDQYAQQALGKSPAEAMQMAQAAAAQTAQSQSDLAVQQAAKAARTTGAMGGQAALAATGQAANAYGTAQQAGQQQYFDTTKLGAQLGSEMSGRLQAKEGDATQRYGIQQGAQSAAAANATARRGQNIQLAGGIIGGLGGLAGLFSDERLKTDIKPDKITDGLSHIKSYTYKYKGGTKPEAGVMAQDLEKTAMAPAVVETPIGKKVDTNRLTTMNTGALSEHEKRLKNIEKMMGYMKSAKKPEGK